MPKQTCKEGTRPERSLLSHYQPTLATSFRDYMKRIDSTKTMVDLHSVFYILRQHLRNTLNPVTGVMKHFQHCCGVARKFAWTIAARFAANENLAHYTCLALVESLRMLPLWMDALASRSQVRLFI